MIGGWLIIILVVALTLLHQSLSAKGLGSGIETSYGAPYLSPGCAARQELHQCTTNAVPPSAQGGKESKKYRTMQVFGSPMGARARRELLQKKPRDKTCIVRYFLPAPNDILATTYFEESLRWIAQLKYCKIR
ncbi:hypothetical protein P167DRAFT_550281 [Morchella conica CCBAS932]|uniref:Secreted protein n=1 Tax=Morchella conica CCBAS932 TaxID=1392247 RepID=A0A3N4K8F1_9PEZI|nr:hypothetical protein P167DRAFT_550281 [Morchella conica CCBAS932]